MMRCFLQIALGGAALAPLLLEAIGDTASARPEALVPPPLLFLAWSTSFMTVFEIPRVSHPGLVTSLVGGQVEVSLPPEPSSLPPLPSAALADLCRALPLARPLPSVGLPKTSPSPSAAMADLSLALPLARPLPLLGVHETSPSPSAASSDLGVALSLPLGKGLALPLALALALALPLALALALALASLLETSDFKPCMSEVSEVSELSSSPSPSLSSPSASCKLGLALALPLPRLLRLDPWPLAPLFETFGTCESELSELSSSPSPSLSSLAALADELLAAPSSLADELLAALADLGVCVCVCVCVCVRVAV